MYSQFLREPGNLNPQSIMCIFFFFISLWDLHAGFVHEPNSWLTCWMNSVLISRWALAHRAVETKQTLLTRDAQVDRWTCCILSCHLVHRLYMVTSCVCRRGCQDDQLIVQSDWSAGHKQDTHITSHYKTLTRSFFFFSSRIRLGAEVWQKGRIWCMDHLDCRRGEGNIEHNHQTGKRILRA